MADIRRRTTSPLDQMNFKVEIDGLALTFGVTAVRGIKKTVGNIEHRSSGTASLIKENHPGLVTVEPVTLSGGIIWTLEDFDKLNDWQRERVNGGLTEVVGKVDIYIYPNKKSASIKSFDETDRYIILKNCEPRDVSITDFDTSSTGFAKFELIVRPTDILTSNE